MYRRTTYDCGRVIDVQCYYPANYGAPGMKRAKRQKRTPEDIARQNHTNRVNRVKRLIIKNFREGDWHLTLNYRKGERPETIEEARDNLRKFLDAVRKALKKAGYTFRYIGVTEVGKKGQALHHHLIIENIKTENIDIVELVKKSWIHGNTYWSAMYEDGDFEQLASYIVKKETKIGTWSSYTRSRGNLEEPKRESETMKRKRWPESPWVKKGYILIKDSLYDGLNPVTGYPYRKYSIRRIEGGRDAGNNLYRDNHTRSG